MRSLSIAVTVGLLLVAALAKELPKVSRPPCDSPDIEAAAMVAQDFINAQHTHGYKYVLNRIEDVKVITAASGNMIYLEVELLETTCHVLDPTPIANCSVRPKMLTAVEGDCDVLLKMVGGALSVTGFKCKSEESREDICVGCPTLLPLNDTSGLDFIHASLATFSRRTNNTFSLLEVGRMSSQVVSGGFNYEAEYVIIEANCDGSNCVPQDNAQQGFCIAQGVILNHSVACRTLAVLVNKTNVPEVNGTVAKTPLLRVIHAAHGHGHHRLTLIHNPELNGLLSSESAESTEVVLPDVGATDVTLVTDAPAIDNGALVTDAPAIDDGALVTDAPDTDDGPLVTDAPDTDDGPLVTDAPGTDDIANVPADEDSTKAAVVKRAVELIMPDVPVPLLLVPQCPGRIRHY